MHHLVFSGELAIFWSHFLSDKGTYKKHFDHPDIERYLCWLFVLSSILLLFVWVKLSKICRYFTHKNITSNNFLICKDNRQAIASSTLIKLEGRLDIWKTMANKLNKDKLEIKSNCHWLTNN